MQIKKLNNHLLMVLFYTLDRGPTVWNVHMASGSCPCTVHLAKQRTSKRKTSYRGLTRGLSD